MDRKLVAVGIIVLIIAIVMMSGCTSGPATNATVKPSPAPMVNKSAANTSDMTNASAPDMGGNNTTYTGVNPVPAMVNNTTKPAIASPSATPR